MTMLLLKQSKNIVLILLCLMAGIAVAQDDMSGESGYPKGHKIGVVDALQHKHNIIVINDFSYLMPLNFKVSDDRGKLVNRFAIKAGDKVEYFAENAVIGSGVQVTWLKIKKL